MRRYSQGTGLLNRTIDALPFELHLPGGYRYCGPGTKLKERLARHEEGINPLDELCKSHDIAYHLHKDTASRRAADHVLANKAWERFKDKSAPLKEKLASWVVTTAMKAKSKLGGKVVVKKRTTPNKRVPKIKKKRGGGKVKRTSTVRTAPLTLRDIVKRARAAIRGTGVKSSKVLEKETKRMRNATIAALKAVRSMKKGRALKRFNKERILPLPKSGGVLPLLPIFAGLSAIGSLAGGAAGVAKAINETKDARKKLAELQRHNETMEAIALRKGKGLFLKPYKKGGLGLYMMPYTKYAKN